MLDEITVAQLGEWIEFARVEPFDETRDDQRAGAIIQSMINMQIAKGKTPLTLDECTPKFGDSIPERKPVMAWQTMEAMARALCETNNAAQEVPAWKSM